MERPAPATQRRRVASTAADSAEYHVLRQAGTERPFTGESTDTRPRGVYGMPGLRSQELFRSTEKFESHCGWPSFFDPARSRGGDPAPDDSLGMRRVEVLCANCHSHLGRVLRRGLPTPTDQRYCINSISLRLVPGRLSSSAQGALGSLLTSSSTLMRGPVKKGISSRTWRRASVARRSPASGRRSGTTRVPRTPESIRSPRGRTPARCWRERPSRGQPYRGRPASSGARRRAVDTSPATARTGTTDVITGLLAGEKRGTWLLLNSAGRCSATLYTGLLARPAWWCDGSRCRVALQGFQALGVGPDHEIGVGPHARDVVDSADHRAVVLDAAEEGRGLVGHLARVSSS